MIEVHWVRAICLTHGVSSWGSDALLILEYENYDSNTLLSLESAHILLIPVSYDMMIMLPETQDITFCILFYIWFPAIADHVDIQLMDAAVE